MRTFCPRTEKAPRGLFQTLSVRGTCRFSGETAFCLKDPVDFGGKRTGRCRDIVGCEDGGDHGGAIDAGIGEHIERSRVQAADAYDGDAHGAADPRELVLGDIDRVRLGGRGDERPDAEVVRTGFLGGTGVLDCLG